MKRLEARVLIFVGIFVMIFGLYYCLNSFLVSQTDTFQLSPLNDAIGGIEYRRYYGEQQGNRVQGSLTITGGDESVWFKIEDPSGATIVDVGAVRMLSFDFTAEYDGSYVFLFLNQEDSWKTVMLTQPRIVEYLSLEFWLLVVGAGAFSLCLGLFGYFSEKWFQGRKNETQAIPPP